VKKQLKNTLYTQFQILCIATLFVACVSPKKMVYFQSEEVTQNELLKNYAPKIQVDDVLNIYVSALDAETATPFNIFQGGTQANTTKPITYLVDTEGTIAFPVLGNIKVIGFTTKELKAYLVGKLESYIKNPIVTIRLENFRITVLGEVKNPGAFNILSERISIPEAIGLAGDLTIQGKRNNILLVRNTDGNFEKIRIDLTNESLFNSPYYYLAQNDVIYVEPNKAKVNSSAVGSNTGVILSSVSILITLITLLTR